MKYLYLPVITLIVLLGCQKGPKEEPVVLPPTSVYIQTSIQGKVVDEHQQPVAGSVITVGTITASTNADGIFRLDSVQVNSQASIVKVSKPGYFKAIRTFTANKGILNFVQLQLIPSNIAGTFSAASGGTVQIPGGGTIVFTPGSIIIAADNVPYAGTVNVSAHFINPASPELPYVMPGDQRGVTLTGQERGLQSFGMVAVELTNDAGNKLQLAPNKTATVTLPIPSSLSSTAPATIPIWYFDEDRGLWQETGKGTKGENHYRFTVNHFSYWNCDVPYPVVQFQVTIIGPNGTPMFNQRVEIGVVGTGYRAYGVTDSTGKVSGNIAAGESLELKVYDKCGSLIYTKPIGTFTKTTDLGIIKVDVPANGNVVISGAALNCSGTAVIKGTVLVLLDSYYYKADITNGVFRISIDRCNTASSLVSILAVDSASLKGSVATYINVTTGVVDAGTLSACNVAVDQFFDIEINGEEKYHVPGSAASLTLQGTDTLHFSVTYRDGNNAMSMGAIFYGHTTGVYIYYIPYINTHNYLLSALYPDQMSIRLTEFGGIGKYAVGNFSGLMTDVDSTMAPVRVSGDFRLIVK